ncbi:MAG: HDIG domain-containing protein [Abditibacteriota bacterium]|nr:HDIG domain-containing protein [Abditibacteriota bacterium]
MKIGQSGFFKLRQRRKKGSGRLRGLVSSIDSVKVISTLVTFCVSLLVMYYFYMPEAISWKAGDLSDRQIIAKSNVTFRDHYSESLLKNQISANEIVYDTVPDAQSDTVSNINLIFTAIASERTDDVSPTTEVIDRLRLNILKYSGGQLSDKTVYTLLTVPDSTFHQVKEAVLVTGTLVMSGEVRENLYFLKETYKEIRKLVNDRFPKQPELADVCYEILVSVVKPNRIYNEEKTLELANDRKNSVKPIYKTIRVGDKVIDGEQRVTEGTIESLKALGLYSGTGRLKKFAYIFCLMCICFGAVSFVMSRLEHTTDRKKVLLINIVLTICCLLFYASGKMFENYFSQMYLGFLGAMWFIAAVMLIFVLSDHKCAAIILVVVSVLLGFVVGDNIRVTTVTLVTGICAIYSLRRIRTRSDIINIYFVAAAATLLQITIYDLLVEQPMSQIARDVMWSVFIIPMSTFVFMLISTVLERLFDITTPMRLVELADTNLPIMRQLSLEAPGTYAHSVSVAYIGELASNEIGADALMVRVGAYYHDIGKLVQPDYYSENQFGHNVHNDLNPSLSSMVIQAHVKNGIDIASKYKIPQVVRDLIRQHHGTTIVSFFYNRFSAGYDGDLEVYEGQFRYPGPKPQTREAAILMLADSCEAASRSLKEANISRVEALVNQVFSSKLADGQLSECPLSLNEIGIVKLSIIRTLTHMLHSRVSYPEEQKKEAEIENQNRELRKADEQKADEAADGENTQNA